MTFYLAVQDLSSHLTILLNFTCPWPLILTVHDLGSHLSIPLNFICPRPWLSPVHSLKVHPSMPLISPVHDLALTCPFPCHLTVSLNSPWSSSLYDSHLTFLWPRTSTIPDLLLFPCHDSDPPPVCELVFYLFVTLSHLFMTFFLTLHWSKSLLFHDLIRMLAWPLISPIQDLTPSPSLTLSCLSLTFIITYPLPAPYLSMIWLSTCWGVVREHTDHP